MTAKKRHYTLRVDLPPEYRERVQRLTALRRASSGGDTCERAEVIAAAIDLALRDLSKYLDL